jgi:hypothetical protein
MAHVTPTLHEFDLSGNVVTHKPDGRNVGRLRRGEDASFLQAGFSRKDAGQRRRLLSAALLAFRSGGHWEPPPLEASPLEGS